MRRTEQDLIALVGLALAVMLVLLILLPDQALASTTGGAGLPWETPLQKVRDSITGPVAYAMSLLGIVVTGAVLVFGGEINEFVRRVIMLILVVSLMVFATDLMSTLFNAGAVV